MDIFATYDNNTLSVISIDMFLARIGECNETCDPVTRPHTQHQMLPTHTKSHRPKQQQHSSIPELRRFFVRFRGARFAGDVLVTSLPFSSTACTLRMDSADTLTEMFVEAFASSAITTNSFLNETRSSSRKKKEEAEKNQNTKHGKEKTAERH